MTMRMMNMMKTTTMTNMKKETMRKKSLRKRRKIPKKGRIGKH